MRAVRRISADSIARLTRLMQPDAGIGHTIGRRAIARIVENPTLAPRAFLGPREMSEAITFVVERSCFENDGRFLLDEPGPSWVCLERALRALHDESWLHGLVAGAGPGVRSLEPPLCARVLAADRLGEFGDGVAAIARRLFRGADTHSARREIDGLLALAERVRATPGWTLAFEYLD
jgi:hypothetical protein